MKHLFAFGAAILTSLVLSTHAQSPDDQYVSIYNLIQEADALNNLDQPTLALPKFLEARTALQNLQKQNPDWHVKVVTFRLNYLTSKIAAVTAKVPATTAATGTNAPVQPGQKPATQTPGKPPVATEHDRQMAALQAEVRSLHSDKTILEAKLKEALATQPATVDPRELAKAQETIQTLMKENDLLKASLATEQTKPASETAPRALEETKKALADANRKLAEQTESAGKLAQEKEALLARVSTLTTRAEASDVLRAENELLKKQVADLKSSVPVNTPAGDSARQLAQAQAQIAALQSDAEILRLEKIALQNRVKQMNATNVTATVVRSPNLPEDAERIKQLERERDDLQNKLEAAHKDLYGRKNRDAPTRIDELAGEITALRMRLEVFEARAVPYTVEELALFKPAEPKLVATVPATDRKPVKPLPADARPLVLEAQRHFSAKEFNKAEESYLKILRKDDKNAMTLANLAAIQIEMNRLDEADKHLKQALAVVPDDADTVSLLGYLRFRQEKYDDALDALSRAAKLDPESARTQNYLGVTLAHKGMRGPAETALRKAIQLEPGYGEAHNNLAVIYASQQPPLIELARWHYQKALAAGNERSDKLEKMLDQKSGGSSAP